MQSLQPVLQIDPKLIHIISESFERAEKELKQVRGTYGSRRQKRGCAVGAFVFYNGNVDPKRPDSLAPKLIQNEIKRVWVEFGSWLCKHYKANVVRLNDEFDWTFARFKEEALKFESSEFFLNRMSEPVV